MKTYIIVRFRECDGFWETGSHINMQAKVQKYIDFGWELLGGVQVVSTPAGLEYFQTMTIDTDKIKEL